MRFTRPLIIILICSAGCVDPYTPKLVKEDLKALVIDGFIDINGFASVKLSRSIEVTAEDDFPGESGAIITVRSSNGSEFDLGEEKEGSYTASGIPIDLNSKYTLYIKTSDGAEYQSDDVSIYPTPPIDSIYFSVEASNDAIDINVDSRDNNPNTTGYYLWEGSETYQYHAETYSGFKLEDHVPIERSPEEQVYHCWRTVPLPPVVSNTHKLSQNVINGQRVSIVKKYSPKLQDRYSILVRQRVISAEEYDFRVALQKSTETQGSLFAPIPGSVVSNVHSINNPSENVLGYFRGQHIQELRFFLDVSELPRDFQATIHHMDCQKQKACLIGRSVGDGCTPLALLGDDAIITEVITDRGVPLYYNYVHGECGDCRYNGGTTTKPDFW